VPVAAGCPAASSRFTLAWTEEQTPRAFADALLASKATRR
jgi:hypothetical protein